MQLYISFGGARNKEKDLAAVDLVHLPVSLFLFPLYTNLCSLPLPQVVGTLDVPSKMVIDLKGD